MNGQFSLDDVGKRCTPVMFVNDGNFGFHQGNCDIVMVVKAPRGVLTILRPASDTYGYYDSPDGFAQQAEAVKAFVEQHRDE